MKKSTAINKAAAINAVHATATAIYPEMIARLKEGYNLKSDGTLYKKDKDDLNKILAPYKDDVHMIYLDVNQYHIAVTIKATYTIEKDGRYQSTGYIEINMYLADPHNGEIYEGERAPGPYPQVTAEQLLQAEADIEKYNEEIREIEAKISALRYPNYVNH